MIPAPDTDASGDPQPGHLGIPPVLQKVTGSDRAQQASLGSGTQNNYFGSHEVSAEIAVSIAPPVGLRDPGLPLRGRDDLLGELADRSLGSVRVVHGLGGCGKTRLVLEAAWLAQQLGAEVWWVSATDESRLTAGMRAVGRRLGVTDAELWYGDAADVLWQRLSALKQHWLLVIDSADDPQVLAGPGAHLREGTGWIRPVLTTTGMVLVTSRDGRPTSWGSWCHRHPVRMLAAGEAAHVLADYAGHQVALGTSGDAADLAKRLGYLPLALKIAGSYLSEAAAVPGPFAGRGLIRTYRSYLVALGGRPEVTLPYPGAELTTEQAKGLIGRTWDLTLDFLDARELPEGRRVLRLLASMADAPVPHELLLSPTVLAGTTLFAGITGPRLWQVLQALEGFGLIDLTTGNGKTIAVTRLHPLVRDASRPRPETDPKSLAEYLKIAARLLYEAAAAEETGLPEDPGKWPMWRLLVPHATRVFGEVTSRPDCPATATEDAAYAAGMAARYQAEQGLHLQVGGLLRDVLAANLRARGADHPETLITRHQIALEMAALGDHGGALAEYQDVLIAKLRILGADHPSTLTTGHAIACEMAALGDHGGALAAYQDVLTAKLRVLGGDHPSTLTTRYEIALEMAALGGHVRALAELQDVLTAWLEVLGVDHPSTLTTRHAIACEMAALGDHGGALAEYQGVLTANMRVLGTDHPSTLATRHQIALEMAALGDHGGALAEYQDVLTAILRVLGADHPETLTTRHQIALEMAALGDHGRALAEYQDVLTAILRVLGADHPSTLTTRHAIACEMAALGDHGGALAEYQDVLIAKLRVLGADHPETLITRHQIALEMAALGDHGGALAEYQDVLIAKLRVLGADHPETLITRHQIALEMAALGDHGGALAEYQDVLIAKLRILGADHPSTLTTRHAIACEMAALGDHGGALAEYQDVLIAKLRVLGADHPSTVTTADCLRYLGQS